MRITVEIDVRCAAGQRVRVAPDVFDQRDGDGVVVSPEPSPASELHQAARDAAMLVRE